MNIEQAFSEAIRAEKSAENLYRGLEQKFCSDPEVASFWNQLAGEEAIHFEWLNNLAGRLSQVDREKLVDTHTQDLFYQVRQFSWENSLANIHDLADAIEEVSELENGETNAIFRFLIDNFEVDTSIKNFLLAQLSTHLTRLSTNLPIAFRDILSRQAVKVSKSARITWGQP
jgi:rubrerythrin